MISRHYSPLDKLILNMDQAVRTVFGSPQTTERANPAHAHQEGELDEQEKVKTSRLMRINHTGEVCAQALYQGQALTAKLPDVRAQLERAAQEENDHLDWCAHRLEQLGSHKSLLNPLWYAGSFAIGALAGAAGDKWSLGFVVETERQVENHLDEHLSQLPAHDEKSRAILQQMKEDEVNHANLALAAGGAPLPAPVKAGMQLTAKLMTKTVYWI